MRQSFASVFALLLLLGSGCGGTPSVDAGGPMPDAGPVHDGGPDADVDAAPGPDGATGHCGDGNLDHGEQCDDGNLMAGDACTPACTLAYCGNGVVDSREECDDGAANGTAPDACRGTCVHASCGDAVVDTGEGCDNGARNSDVRAGACRTNCQLPTCGDGILDPTEGCDDGNTMDGDHCRADCTLASCGDGAVQTGEECDDGPANDDVAPDACRTTCRHAGCGDGVVDTSEACDDHNALDGDACESDCTLPGCGNGRLDSGEACDDGNTAGGDACSSDCARIPRCGDAAVDHGLVAIDATTVSAMRAEWLVTGPSAHELTVTVDGVSFASGVIPPLTTGAHHFHSMSMGTPEALAALRAAGATHHVVASTTPIDLYWLRLVLTTPAGDRAIVLAEGTVPYGYARSPGMLGALSGLEVTTRFTRVDSDLALEADVGEACDEGPGAYYCTDSCTPTDACGDGVATFYYPDPSRCDDGNLLPNDGCNPSCYREFCGDGVLQPSLGELCDDGNTTDADGCSSTCAPNVCGNGTIEPGERCDDGNAIGGDGCASNCTSTEACGNGLVDTTTPIRFHGATVVGLVIDYAAGGDGAPGTIALSLEGGPVISLPFAAGWCDGTRHRVTVTDPAVLAALHEDTLAYSILPDIQVGITGARAELTMSDGRVIAVTIGPDYSASSCFGVVPYYGAYTGTTSYVIGEECDDGNVAPLDGCSPTCHREYCGDHLVSTGEVCDDGNNVAGDGCSPDCLSDGRCGNAIVDTLGPVDPSVVTAVRLRYSTATHQPVSARMQISANGTPLFVVGAVTHETAITTTDAATLAALHAGDNAITLSVLAGSFDAFGGTLTLIAPGRSWSYDLDATAGHVQYTESCDDGNTDDADGCTRGCYTSFVAYTAACGNGTLDVGEQCDDGNVDSGDGCAAGCTAESFCGDGITQATRPFLWPASGLTVTAATLNVALGTYYSAEAGMSLTSGSTVLLDLPHTSPYSGYCGTEGAHPITDPAALALLGTGAPLSLEVHATSGYFGYLHASMDLTTPSGVVHVRFPIEVYTDCYYGGLGVGVPITVEIARFDGTITGEECDDANPYDFDGCHNDCTL